MRYGTFNESILLKNIVWKWYVFKKFPYLLWYNSLVQTKSRIRVVTRNLYTLDVVTFSCGVSLLDRALITIHSWCFRFRFQPAKLLHPGFIDCVPLLTVAQELLRWLLGSYPLLTVARELLRWLRGSYCWFMSLDACRFQPWSGPVLHTFHPFISPCVTALSESVTSHVGSRPPPAPLSGGAHSPYDNTSVKATPQWPG